MGTLECIIKKKYPLHHILTKEDKEEIIEENKDINISYLSLIKEQLRYSHTTVNDLLSGWGGIKLYKIDKI